jgi:hypothetical protein
MPMPRTTHQWLQPFYRAFVSPTGILGVFGATGSTRLTALGLTGSAAQGGMTGTTFFDFRTNGGTGTNYVNFTELVGWAKRIGFLAP